MLGHNDLRISLLPRPAPGRRGGRRRATGQPRTGGLHRNGRSEAEDRAKQAIAMEDFKEARLRPARSGLYGSAAHRAAGGQQNAPAACGRLRKAFSSEDLVDALAARRCSTNCNEAWSGARPKKCVVCARDRSRRPRPHLAVSVHESPGPRLAGGARHDKSLRTFCFRRGSSRHTAHSSKACRTVVVMTPCSARRSRTSERSASRRARERSASKRIS